MDLTNIKELKEFLEENSFFIKKSLGQNFLVDKNILKKIVESAEITKKDTIIEVGAGVGTLTKSLAKRAKKVIAVEKDKKIIPLLKENTKKEKNIEIVEEDILSYNITVKNYKVVANLPYYITSPIIRKFLEESYQPSLILLTIQKEVAQRIAEKPPKMSLLAVSVQFYAKAEILFHISPSCFYPMPGVYSSVIKITPTKRKEYENESFRKAFFLLARAGFSCPRKQLQKNFSLLDKRGIKELNLSKTSFLERLKKSDIDLRRRAETLTIEEWINLTKKLIKR